MFVGYFNARISDWWTSDIPNFQGIELGDLTAQHYLHQIIDAPTHVLPNSASCIDLIFLSAMDLIIDSGVLPSLFPRCHHHLVFTNLNFKVSFPPAYKCRVFDFYRANIPAIHQTITGINLDTAFIGLNVEDRVSFLTDCLFNVFRNFVPNKDAIKNYRPVSLLPIFSKLFERRIYDIYFEENTLCASCQSGFCKCDSCNSCMSQLKKQQTQNMD